MENFLSLRLTASGSGTIDLVHVSWRSWQTALLHENYPCCSTVLHFVNWHRHIFHYLSNIHYPGGINMSILCLWKYIGPKRSCRNESSHRFDCLHLRPWWLIQTSTLACVYVSLCCVVSSQLFFLLQNYTYGILSMNLSIVKLPMRLAERW